MAGITKAFRQRAKKYHPDMVSQEPQYEQDQAREQFQLSRQAYENLMKQLAKPLVRLNWVEGVPKRDSPYEYTVAEYEKLAAANPGDANVHYNLAWKYFDAWMLEEDVARELARIDLPLSTYTQWYWKIDLHNLLHFLTLRVDPRAQWEIREYGRVLAAMVRRVAPLSYEAWVDYDLSARSFTRAEREALTRLVSVDGELLRAVDGATLSKQELGDLGMSAREIAELVEKLAAPGRPDFELDLNLMRAAEDVGKEMAEAVPGTEFE